MLSWTDEPGEESLDFSECIVVDFGEMNKDLLDKSEPLMYMDLSPSGDFEEAISNIYDYLWKSETQDKGKMVLLSNVMEADSHEH